MPLRGENVGTAYVRVLADGTGLKRSIKKEFDGARGQFVEEGERGGEGYGEGFERAYVKQSHKNRRELLRGLRAAVGEIDGVGETLGNNLFKGIDRELKKQFENSDSRIGDSISRQMKEAFAESRGGFDELKRIVEDVRKFEKRALLEIAADDKRIAAQREQEARELGAALKKIADEQRDIDRKHGQAIRENASFDRRTRREATAEYEKLLTLTHQLESGERDISHTREEGLDRIRKLNVELARMQTITTGDNQKHFGTLERDLAGIERRVRSVSPSLRQFRGDIDRVADTVGRGFGRGSRNDFINFLGSTARNTVRLLGLLPRLAEDFMGVAQIAKGTFKAAFDEAGGGFKGLISGSSALTKSFGGSLALALGKGVAGFAALMVTIGPLVAILSLLTAAVVALAGSLSFALVGAVASVTAVLLPAITLFGGFAVALKSLSNKQFSELRDSFQKFSKPFTKSFREEMPHAIDAFKKALGGVELRTFADKLGSAIGKTTTAFAESLSGPTFKNFIRQLGTFLPAAVERFGKISRQAFGGFGGILVAMIPVMNRTLKYLDDITLKFSKWANSAEGQSTLLRFFDNAEASLKSVGKFLGSVLGLIGELFSAGRESGDDLFTSMAKNIDKLTRRLEQNPEALKKWFKDGVEFARELGDVLVIVAKAFDFLDNKVTRFIALHLGDVFRGIAIAASFAFGGPIVGTIVTLLVLMQRFHVSLSDIGDAFKNIGGASLRGLANVGEGIYRFLTLPLLVFIEALRFALKGAAFLHIPGAKQAKEDLDKAKDAVNGLATSIGRLGDKKPKIGVNHDEVDDAKDSVASLYKLLGGTPPEVRVVKGKELAEVRRALADVLEAMSFVRGFPTLNPKSSDSGLKPAKDGLTATENLIRSLRGQPPILPKTDPEPLKILQGFAKDAVDALVDLNLVPGARPKVDEKQIRDGINVSKTLISTWAKVLGIKPSKPKVDKKSVDDGLKVIKSLITAWARILNMNPNKTFNVITNYKSRGSSPGGTGPSLTATGGIFDGAQVRVIAEAGREAVVPLDRPLSQVDPAVRWLSAIAQGKTMLGGTTTHTTKSIDASGWNIYSNSEDAGAVAQETIDRLTHQGF